MISIPKFIPGETAVSHLHNHGVEFESAWREGESHVFLKDPDGLVIEIIQEEA